MVHAATVKSNTVEGKGHKTIVILVYFSKWKGYNGEAVMKSE